MERTNIEWEEDLPNIWDMENDSRLSFPGIVTWA